MTNPFRHLTDTVIGFSQDSQETPDMDVDLVVPSTSKEQETEKENQNTENHNNSPKIMVIQTLWEFQILISVF